eukprot:g20512.t1
MPQRRGGEACASGPGGFGRAQVGLVIRRGSPQLPTLSLAGAGSTLRTRRQKVEKTQLQLRFNGTEVEKLPSGFIAGWGPDDLYYPPWMEGRDSHAQWLRRFYPNSRASWVSRSPLSSGTSARNGAPLRLTKCQRSRGREVVKSVEYVDVPDNTRESTMQGGNGPQDPLRTVIVNFKALQFEDGSDGDVWRGLASTRTLFAAPGAGYNPLTVDEEVVTALRKTDAEIKGRLRLLGFLNPNDQLFFKAGNRAVSIADYSLKFEPIKDSDSLQERVERQRWGRFGSKIFHVVRKLRAIDEEDPTARAIVFVQWKTLRRKVAEALTEFKVPYERYDTSSESMVLNSFWQRDDVLTSFQNAPPDSCEGPKVLLLSLQDAASGTNLTRANHVLLVHPMLASTHRLSVAYELQALGRCLRLGQRRRVCLWRFVTLGTVEEDLSYRHQQELWQSRPELIQARAEARVARSFHEDCEAEEDLDFDDLFW